MTTATVLAWKSAIKHLQQLTADPGNRDAVESATSELLSLCDDISSKALPSATVKKLVNELKVRLLRQQLQRTSHIHAANEKHMQLTDGTVVHWAPGCNSSTIRMHKQQQVFTVTAQEHCITSEPVPMCMLPCNSRWMLQCAPSSSSTACCHCVVLYDVVAALVSFSRMLPPQLLSCGCCSCWRWTDPRCPSIYAQQSPWSLSRPPKPQASWQQSAS